MTKRNSGFTVIELLIVIGIMSILTVALGSNYFGTRSRIAFENQVYEITADLRLTMSRSKAQENDGQWGIRFSNPVGDSNDFYETWYGDSYATGTVMGRTNLHGSVTFLDPASGGTKDIIFSKATGLPVASSTIELLTLTGNSTATIDVNTQGRINFTLD